jgi:hypothetical protein
MDFPNLNRIQQPPSVILITEGGFFMVRKILSLGVIMVTLLMNTACLTETRDPEAGRYDEDGVLGMTNTNPNLRTSPTHYNYDADTHMMESTLREIRGVLDQRILINGENAYVKIRIPDGLTRNEIEQIEADAYDALSFQVPRYVFHLTSDKSNLRRNQKVDP